jgi:hypothetical protein
MDQLMAFWRNPFGQENPNNYVGRREKACVFEFNWREIGHRGRSIAEVDVSEISRQLLLQGPDHRRLGDVATFGNVTQRQTFPAQFLNLGRGNGNSRPP